MDEHAITHDTFVLERTFPVPPAAVFAAFTSEQAKARWGATPGVELAKPAKDGQVAGTEFDVRPGGRECFTMEMDGIAFRYDAHYYDVVPDARLVYS